MFIYIYRIYPTCRWLQPMDLSQDRHSLSWGKLFGCAWNPNGFIPSHPVDSHLRMAQFPKE